ncbi:MAG: GtrA family protein [Verrucomicrobia bacterium]|nr:GtrA family protein [Verrucomicrobiota bacterium]MCH8511968.1 GtrA family protein [Kiritimatiellia bacterium]
MTEAPREIPPIREWRQWLAWAASHDAHPLIQFLKYGIAGGLALFTDVFFFTLSNLFLFPIDPGATSLEMPSGGFGEWVEWMRIMRADPSVINYVRCNIIGFLFSNVVAYVLNVKWVFRGGRHPKHMEMFLFLLVSFVAFLLGTAIGAFLVGTFGLNEYLAKAGNVVAAILINFVFRKFVVFQG